MRNVHPPCRPFLTSYPVQASWDDDNPGPMEGLFWESPHNRDENGNPQPTTMTPEQIAAAQLLGHTPETWNHGMTQDDAATKIAAAFHGRKQRKKFQMQVSALLHPTQQCTAEPRVAASQPARAIRRKQQGKAVAARGRPRQALARSRLHLPAEGRRLQREGLQHPRKPLQFIKAPRRWPAP